MKRSWHHVLWKKENFTLFLILFVFLGVVVVSQVLYGGKPVASQSPPPMALTYEEVLHSYTEPPS